MPGGEVNNPVGTILTTTIINSNINIRKIKWETFILLIEKCHLCAVCLLFFHCGGLTQDERQPALQSESHLFTLQCHDRVGQSRGSREVGRPPRNGARKKEREKECRAGKTEASSVAQIWQGLVRQLSVPIQTQDLVEWVCVCVCACCGMLLPRPQGSDKEIQSAQRHRSPGGRRSHGLLLYTSVLSLARQGQVAAQHGNQSDAQMTRPQGSWMSKNNHESPARVRVRGCVWEDA